MSDKIFNSEWLEERFRFDNAARNKRVEAAFFDFISDLENISIVDLGSGTGANFLYFFDKIEINQRWFLIEKDRRFIEPTLERLEYFAAQKGYSIQKNHQSLKIQTDSKRAEISLINESFFKLQDLVDLKNIDVIMAAALFDLLTEKQFETIAALIFSNNIPLLATMNYFDTIFHLKSESDRKFINSYNDHMRREQLFGRSLGNAIVPFMENYFIKNDIHFLKGSSDWKIKNADFRMQKILLDFIENAVSELLDNGEENDLFKKWMLQKRSLSEKKLLGIRVAHFDFFALPN